ncbi:MAG TPA: uroporphyrinogen-III synthase [Rhodocyclaceae bacterium]|nr:uroporphyrinogen-III synthase [Rhodocyclaceae bacterium]
MSEQPLAGRHIVVTRPAGQATHLAQALVELGASPVLFPVLSIKPLDDLQPLLDAAIRLDDYDLAVFVSPNAVDQALTPILARRLWPAHLKAATVGKSSEAALARHGVTQVIAPADRFDSEALIAMPELQNVAGWKVVIFRGDGGRELLGDTLIERGATVDYVTSYRRGKPDTPPTSLMKLWNEGHLDAVTLTSSEGLRNLYDMLDQLGRAYLRATPLFVPHARIAEQARALGMKHLELTGPGDEGLVNGLMRHFAS